MSYKPFDAPFDKLFLTPFTARLLLAVATRPRRAAQVLVAFRPSTAVTTATLSDQTPSQLVVRLLPSPALSSLPCPLAKALSPRRTALRLHCPDLRRLLELSARVPSAALLALERLRQTRPARLRALPHLALVPQPAVPPPLAHLVLLMVSLLQHIIYLHNY